MTTKEVTGLISVRLHAVAMEYETATEGKVRVLKDQISSVSLQQETLTVYAGDALKFRLYRPNDAETLCRMICKWLGGH